MHRRLFQVVEGGEVCPVFGHGVGVGGVSVAALQVQRGLARLVLGVAVGPVSEQQLDYGRISPETRSVQGRKAKDTFGERCTDVYDKGSETVDGVRYALIFAYIYPAFARMCLRSFGYSK